MSLNSFHWRFKGPRWQISKDKRLITAKIASERLHGWNSIYTAETINSVDYVRLRFDLEIVNAINDIDIGIVNNSLNQNSYFTQNIVQPGVTTEHIYYSINCDGTKCSHTTKHKQQEWTSDSKSAKFKSGDTISLLIDFKACSISFYKNGNNITDRNNNQMFSNIDAKYFQNINFRLGVSCGAANACIKLLPFDPIKHLKNPHTSFASLIDDLNDYLEYGAYSSSQLQPILNTDPKTKDKCFNIALNFLDIYLKDLIQHKVHVHVDDDHDHDEKCDAINVAKMKEQNDLETKIDEIAKWNYECKQLSKLTFEDMMNNYSKSLNLCNEQKQKRLMLSTKNVIPTFETKLKSKKALSKLKLIAKTQEQELKQITTQLNDTISSMQQLKKKIDENMKNIIQYKTSRLHLDRNKQTKEVELRQTQSDIASQTAIVDNCDLLLNKCNEFDKNSQQCARDAQVRRNNALQEFESKWMKWNYRQIVFWFKVKLRYFESSMENMTNNEDSKDENDVLSIDFDNKIYCSLESQRIRGKFLSLIDRNDLRNLGFKLFKHQCILHKSIAKLVEKYPIPKDDYNVNDDDEIEGLNVQITQNLNNDETLTNKYDDKFLCPITKELMKTPVIAYDGCTYEKEAIIQYLRKNHTTPNQKSEKLENEQEVEQMIQMLFDHHDLKQQIRIAFSDIE